MLKKIIVIVIGFYLFILTEPLLASGAYIPVSRIPRTRGRYIKGQEIISGHVKEKGVPSCRSCHKGSLKFKRGRLLAIKGQLASKIGCGSRGHAAFCRNISRKELTSLVAYLKRRYRLGS